MSNARIYRSRHPTAAQRDGEGADDPDLLSPEEFLRINQNGNTRKNSEVALRTYERVMSEVADKTGEVYEDLMKAGATASRTSRTSSPTAPRCWKPSGRGALSGCGSLSPRPTRRRPAGNNLS